jgi:hypothetical protein
LNDEDILCSIKSSSIIFISHDLNHHRETNGFRTGIEAPPSVRKVNMSMTPLHISAYLHEKYISSDDHHGSEKKQGVYKQPANKSMTPYLNLSTLNVQNLYIGHNQRYSKYKRRKGRRYNQVHRPACFCTLLTKIRTATVNTVGQRVVVG